MCVCEYARVNESTQHCQVKLNGSSTDHNSQRFPKEMYGAVSIYQGVRAEIHGGSIKGMKLEERGAGNRADSLC